MGQSSIFDLGDAAPDQQEAGRAHHPPIGLNEFDRRELLRLEKETLGTYLSSHPLAEVRDALRARVDCSLSELSGKADGSFITVGGIVSEFKRHRTKRGDPMAFLTLDDVEGQVETLVLGKAYSEATDVLAVDSVLVVRGRLDHADRGQTKLIAQEVERFEPSADEVAQARQARVTGPILLPPIEAADFDASLIDELKAVFAAFPGETEVILKMQTREGARQLRFGDAYRVRESAALHAELDALLGTGAQAA